MTFRPSVRRPVRSRLGAGFGVACVAVLGWPSAIAHALPEAPRLFCDTYPEAPQCVGRLVTCSQCHVSTYPPVWNAYGDALLAELGDAELVTGLREALLAVEDADADGDGASNLDEIQLGTWPGDERSSYATPEAPWGLPNAQYDVGNYDYGWAYKRVMVLYCGRSPTYEEMAPFRATLADDGTVVRDTDGLRDVLHETLSECLRADYWRTTGLRELADPKVKPIEAVGAATDVEIGDIRVVLADYDWDYRLWRWLLSDDRDMRELLTAQYHVEEKDGQLQVREGNIPDPALLRQIAGGQPLRVDQRAGMLTTQWFLMSNTMFSALPRTTAAQAYRAYLGMDISQHEGIWPVADEPSDIDGKGVTTQECAGCHSTLDPLSYAYAYYEGIILEPNRTGMFDVNRPARLMPGWDPARQRAVLFGEPVASVVEWGQVASRSDAFRRTLAAMFFRHALGREPTAGEFEEFGALVASMEGDGYSADRLIHRLIDTDAFGVP